MNYGERGSTEQSKEYFSLSMKLKPNVIAARCIAVLQSTPEEAWGHFQRAWKLLDSDSWTNKEDPALERLYRNMVVEISFFLIQENWLEQMQWFMEAAPEETRVLDGYLSLRLTVLLAEGKNEDALALLSNNCFPTYAKVLYGPQGVRRPCASSILFLLSYLS